MIELDGVYYDGRVSQPIDVRLHFDDRGNLKLSGPGLDAEYPFSGLKFSPRIGNVQRDILLPDGGKCETFDNDAIDRLLVKHRAGRFSRLLHALESRLVYVLGSLILTVLFAWAFVDVGIPAIAKQVAFSLPEETDAALGNQSLLVLDRLLFSESELPEAVRDRLSERFRGMVRGMAFESADPESIQLLFRNGDRLGANAIALPSGIVVVTDQLVELAGHDDEIIAILAHELGHVKNRHGLRTVLQGSAVILVISWLTGDISSLSALSAALPAQIIEAKYSRAFEREADLFARDYLTATEIPLHRFSDILSRLEAESPPGGSGATFLSSHPATEDRIRLFDGESTPAHTDFNPQ